MNFVFVLVIIKAEPLHAAALLVPRLDSALREV